MINKYPQLNIQLSEKLNVEKNFFDFRLFLDLESDSIRHKKDYVLPIELECFLPYSFDLLSNVAQDEKDINKTLGIVEKNKKAEDKKEAEFKKNIKIIGNSKGLNVYPSVSKTFKTYNLNSYKDNSEFKRKEYTEEEDINLYPLKLLLATLTYEQLAVEDPDEREIMDLLLDKITLAAFLPFFPTTQFWSKLKFKEDDGAFRSYSDVKVEMIKLLEENNPLKGFFHTSMIEEKYVIKLSRSTYWQPLLDYALNWEEDHAKILIPVDLLDEILSDHLQNVFEQLKKDNIDGFMEVMDNIHQLKNFPDEVRKDYGFFYPIVDEFLKKQNLRSGLQLLKQKYYSEESKKEFSSFLPFVEEIDLRPIQWAKEAMQITTEMNIAAKRYKWAKEAFDKIVTNDAGKMPDDLALIDQLSNEFRNVSSEWFIAKSKYEHLKNRIGKEGIELTLQEQVSTDGVKIDHFFTLTRKRIESKNVILQKTQLNKWIENYTIRRCKRTFFFKSCRNEYRSREVSGWRTWYETVVQYYSVDKPIGIDFDPIGSYLQMNINVQAIGDVKKAQDLGRSLKLPEELISNISAMGDGERIGYKGLLNKDKEVHIFNYIEGEYRDQNNIPLTSLLRDLEAHGHNGSGQPNQQKLFILPQLSKSVSGENVIEKYLAVHNPVAGRRTNIAPRLYIVETYKHTIEQISGHWLGKLSHTTCLFPGETRKIKMATASRYESSLSQNTSKKQTSAIRQKEDVRNQVRNELEKENSSSENNNWSANASGGAKWGSGSVKASASASGSKTLSNAHVAKTLNDKVSEVLNDISSNNEVQFVTTTTNTLSESSTSESEIEISNVNKGRSVNYKFFQILHKYVSRVLLDNLKIVVEYNNEVIPGLDVVQTKVYNLEDLEDILPELVEEERIGVKDQLRILLNDRYQDSLLKIEDKVVFEIDNTKAISEEETYVNSGAFYLDNEVSVMPATEEYVESVRAAELEKFKAETQKILAESSALSDGKILFPKEINSMSIYGWQQDLNKQDGPGPINK